MPDVLLTPGAVNEIERVENEELAELGNRVDRLRDRDSEVSDESSEFPELLHSIRDWVLQATRDERFADQLLLGQLAILWLEVEDAVARQDQDDFEMAVAMIDEAIRRADRRSMREGFDKSPQRAIEYVLEILPDLSSGELAELFGLSERTVRAWRNALPERPQAEQERLSTLAQVLFDITPSTTDRGALRWFHRRLYQLGERTPLDLLNEGEPSAYEELRAVARASRGQGA